MKYNLNFYKYWKLFVYKSLVLILYPTNELWSNIRSGLIFFHFAKSLWIFPWHVANGIIHHWYFFDSIITWHIFSLFDYKCKKFHLSVTFIFLVYVFYYTFLFVCGGIVLMLNLTNHRWSLIKLLNETIQKSFFNYLSISKYKNINNKIIVCKCWNVDFQNENMFEHINSNRMKRYQLCFGIRYANVNTQVKSLVWYILSQ